MWDRLSDTADSLAMGEMVRLTEDEIFSDAVNSDSFEQREAGRDIVDDNSQIEGWDGGFVDDGELMREATGDLPVGYAGIAPTLGEEAAAAEIAALNDRIAQLEARNQQLEPAPTRPDMFADPQAWEANILAQHNGVGMPIDYGTPLANKPDMFGDPEGYERWLLAEMDRRSGVAEHTEARVNSSLAAAHQIHGDAFETAYRDITSLDTRDPRAREAVRSIMSAPDPGNALMAVHSMLRGANEGVHQYGGVPFWETRSRGQGAALRSRGLGAEAATTAAQRAEEDIFDSVWD
jgi:hypothetical protein